MPRKRLLFAGIQNDDYLIHHKQGGLAHSYQLAFFGDQAEQTGQPDLARLLQSSSTGVADLRGMVHTVDCRSMVELKNEAVKNFSSDSSRH